MQAAKPRQTPRKPRRWLYPAGAERDYQRQLVAIADRCTGMVESRLLPALRTRVRRDAANWPAQPVVMDDETHRMIVSIVEDMAATGALGDSSLAEIVLKVGQQTVTFNGAQLHAVLRSAYGVDVFAREPQLRDTLAVWERENIALIKSIPTRYAEQLRSKVVDAVQRGTSLREMVKQVRETYDLPRNRAELIARDQIGKLNGQLTEIRQQAIGVEEYRWRGTMDERERELHRVREGKTYRWDKPPSDGHPGQPIRCRCSAEAVLPEYDDLMAEINTGP